MLYLHLYISKFHAVNSWLSHTRPAFMYFNQDKKNCMRIKFRLFRSTKSRLFRSTNNGRRDVMWKPRIPNAMKAPVIYSTVIFWMHWTGQHLFRKKYTLIYFWINILIHKTDVIITLVSPRTGVFPTNSSTVPCYRIPNSNKTDQIRQQKKHCEKIVCTRTVVRLRRWFTVVHQTYLKKGEISSK